MMAKNNRQTQTQTHSLCLQKIPITYIKDRPRAPHCYLRFYLENSSLLGFNPDSALPLATSHYYFHPKVAKLPSQFFATDFARTLFEKLFKISKVPPQIQQNTAKPLVRTVFQNCLQIYPIQNHHFNSLLSSFMLYIHLIVCEDYNINSFFRS